ncbi:MAG: ABC transporter permease [Rhodobacteraceae bacterium]|jgi:putative spermidine/putrescine transport system permease protein|uniref:Putative spermidine/putrescine transport system permease protein n=1 Tax=Salipiger profundus TaxID=1229727 RepID=A0A1U7D9K9_9RHOB|nr:MULTISPECIES: ABC transporter permease [Salipiger]APX24750.1 putative spermidine/putrescine transport system permease protein [Salipiger profundus]MAB07671.1 ABC transporter permease [Paracoccaceae bacterium]GFZ97500.1 ABC transporter permease [Salipiger profundus]SFD00341.1 putative spermidine/putrescine transport system permease protein [Salipiger profundus]
MTARPWLLSAPALVLFGVLLLVPLGMTFVLSFNSFDFYEGIIPTFSFENYAEVLGDSYFWEIFGRTFGIALATTAICALIGVPQAYILYRLSPMWRSIVVLIVIGPLLISVVVRTLGWAILLGNRGVINTALENWGLIERPIKMMYTEGGIVLALVHVFVPFMVLAVWAALQRKDPSTEAAAESLGASAFTVFRRIVLPQTIPGILSGSLIVFSMSASAFATPAILGGRRVKVVATTVYDEFLNTLDWPLGAAIAMLLLASVMVIMLAWNRLVERRYGEALE